MIEPIMYLGIGFLVATLCALMVVPLVHNRAVRLTTRRLEAATPLSMAEIQADKDQLRAEFAMSARRLEMSVEQLKAKTTSQLAELGKKSDAINRLKHELGEKNATIFSLEAREKTLRDQLRTTEEEFNSKTQSLRDAEQALRDKKDELAKLSHELSDRSATAESRQTEIGAMKAQIETLQGRVQTAEQEHSDARQRLDQQRSQSETATRDLTEARGNVENLGGRVSDLDRQLLVQTKETEMLTSRVADLESRLALQGKILAEREYENGLLRKQVEVSSQSEQSLREELASGGGKSAALEKIRAEKAAVEEQLVAARDERAKLQRDINAMQQQAENNWATERMENALLRERINDIAAEVAKLAVTIEGPDSPIEAILAAEQQKPAISAIVNGTAQELSEAHGTLAQRIRALQAHASRARQIG